jgi:dolichyl-phosphate-mannose-protein mannosyltransferase
MKKKWKYIIILGILSFITHFIYIQYPKEVVFDEVHYGTFAMSYLKGAFYFDVHPPLAKLLIAGVAKLSHFNPASVDFEKIASVYGDNRYIPMRLLSSFFGFILPLLIFFLCRELFFSEEASFCAGLLIILENSLLVGSRFILVDSMLIAFGFTSLLFYLVAKRKNKKDRGKSFTDTYTFYQLLSAFFLACAISVKWTGLSFLGLIGLIELWQYINPWISWKIFIKNGIRFFLIFILLPFVFYFTVFAIHFHILKYSGTGDPFMTPAFQKTLIGSQFQNRSDIQAEITPLKFIELNIEMYIANRQLTASHPYSSKWYSWPYMARPIYYWVNNKDEQIGGKEAKIYLIGNPFIYWFSSFAVLLLLLSFTLQFKNHKKNWKVPLFLLIAYFANLLPFMFIGRVMFLYHYFTALIFAIIILVYCIDKIPNEKRKKEVIIGTVIIAFIFFMWFLPLIYGIPLTPHLQKLLFWFPSWQ